uniref:Secreted protein n=1 Tax=Syphacia muris TaxID=451379 RepID=A0A0N5AL47_9BILA
MHAERCSGQRRTTCSWPDAESCLLLVHVVSEIALATTAPSKYMCCCYSLYTDLLYHNVRCSYGFFVFFVPVKYFQRR